MLAIIIIDKVPIAMRFTKRSDDAMVYLKTAFYILGIFLFFLSCSKEKNEDLFNLTWQKYKDNPVVIPANHGWDQKQVYVGTVLKINDDFKMWYYGRSTAAPFRIGIRESSDGKQWKELQDKPVLTPSDEQAWDSIGVSKPCVIKEDNQYKMWYIGDSRQNNKLIPRVGVALSEDGISWKKSDENPIFDLRDFQLQWASFLRYFWVLKDSIYKAWFSAAGEGPYQNVESIGYAFSEDGISWNVYPDPVLERDTLSLWEDFYVSNPMVIKKDSTYYMFYGGLGRYGYLFQESIGIAKSADGISWQRYSYNPIVYFTESRTAWDREFVTNPRVLQLKKDLYYLWYVGADKKTTLEELGNYQIGLAIGSY